MDNNNTVKNKTEKKFIKLKPSFICFGVVFVILLIQHYFVGMYHDDYGNASLTYGYSIPNVTGTNYSIPDIISYLNWHYFNWTGRVLFYFIYIILMKFGIHFFMAAQAAVITGILYLMYKISNIFVNHKNSYLPIIVLFSLYAFIDISILRHGIYWAAAASTNLWPILPMLAGILIYLKSTIKKKNGEYIKKHELFTMGICFLISGLSHEQIGITVITFLIVHIIVTQNKSIFKFIFLDMTALLPAIVGYAILFFAPGNFVRLNNSDASGNFASLSLIKKVSINFPIIINYLTRSDMFIYNFLLLIGLIFMISRHKYFMQRMAEIWFLIAIFIAALVSQFVMLVSPQLPGRMLIIYLFLIFIVIIVTIGELINWLFTNIRKLIYFGVVALLVLSLPNFITIFMGYFDNYNTLISNNEILRQKSINKSDNSITVKMLPNDLYAASMPYQKGLDYINVWIKNYYNIPQDVRIKWTNGFKMTISAVSPKEIKAREGFNVQSNGMSALSVTGENFLPGSVIYLNGKPMEDTAYGNKTIVSCFVNDDFYKASGELTVQVIYGDNESNKVNILIK